MMWFTCTDGFSPLPLSICYVNCRILGVDRLAECHLSHLPTLGSACTAPFRLANVLQASASCTTHHISHKYTSCHNCTVWPASPPAARLEACGNRLAQAFRGWQLLRNDQLTAVAGRHGIAAYIKPCLLSTTLTMQHVQQPLQRVQQPLRSQQHDTALQGHAAHL